MSTAPPAPPISGPAAVAPHPVSAHRLLDHRARVREKALAVLLLLVAFVVTIVLLSLQWLDNGAQAGSAPAGAHVSVSGVQRS
jgi:hypothetical protein